MTTETIELSQETALVVIEAFEPPPAFRSRLTVVLHPNQTRIDIALNDRLFNKEQYASSRKQEPQGAEKELLELLNTRVVGIDSAKTSKNTLHLEIGDGVLLREFIPLVIAAVHAWGSVDGAYEPEIHVENRRWVVEPIYRDYGTISEGVREAPTQPDIGVPYKIFTSGV